MLHRTSHCLHRTRTGTALLLLGITLAPASQAALARASSGELPGATRSDTDEGQRRIVQLADGGTFRGRARPAAEGAWELDDHGTWRSVPALRITRVRLERDVLAERARLASGLAPNDHVRRLALCDWLAREALVPELARELERVLAAYPDLARARELATSPRLARTLPPAGPDPARERERALRAGAQGGAVERELWIARLDSTHATPAERETLRAALEAEITQSVDTRRSFGAHALRRLCPGAALPALERCAVSDKSRGVRSEARRALRDAHDPAVVARVAPRMASVSPDERLNAIDALGESGYGAAVAPLVSHLAHLLATPAQSGSGNGIVPRSHLSSKNLVGYVQDYNVEIAQAASIADPIVGIAEEGVILDVAAATWQLPGVRYEGFATCRALARVTGEGWRRTPNEWLAWWDATLAKAQAASGVNTPSASTPGASAPAAPPTAH